jgi:hypothetical protein
MGSTHTKLGADAGKPDDILRGQNEIETLELSPDSGLSQNITPSSVRSLPPLSLFRPLRPGAF